MTGELSVLNVGAGDIKIVFNQADKPEFARAVRMLTDMRARGYAIMVELPDGSYVRAHSFDAGRGRYVIVVPEDAILPEGAELEPVKHGKKRGRPPTKRASVSVTKTRAVGIARSAGG